MENKNLKMGRTAFYTALITLGFVVVLGMITIFSFVSFSPKKASSMFDDFGINNASYAIYKRTYDKNKTNSSLYNVLQKAIEVDDYESIIKYGNIMLNIEDSESFFKSIDVQTREILGDKKSIYASSYESYVRRNLTKAYYKLGDKSQSKLLAIESTYTRNADELLEYILCVYEDINLSENDKINEIKSLNNYNLIEKLDGLVLSNELASVMASLDYQKALLTNERIKLLQCKYYIISAIDDDLKNEIQKNIELLVNDLKHLTSNME